MIAVVSSATIALYLLDRSKSPDPVGAEHSTSTELSIDPRELELGTVWESSQHVHALTIRNTRDRPLKVIQLRASCTCSSVNPDSFEVPANGEVTVQLTLDLMLKKPDGLDPGKSWTFAVTLSPDIERVSSELRDPVWTLTGTVRPALNVDTTRVHFGTKSEDALPVEATFPVTAEIPLKEFTVALDILSPGWEAEVQATSISGGYEVRVRTPERMPIGTADCLIRLTAVSQSGETLPSKTIRVTGVISNDVTASPPSIVLGAREVGSECEEVIFLESLTGKPFGEVQVEARFEGTTVTLREQQNRISERCFALTQQILSGGLQRGEIEFVVSTTSGYREEIQVRVPIQYLGIESEASEVGDRN